jgi:hypothetical protein
MALSPSIHTNNLDTITTTPFGPQLTSSDSLDDFFDRESRFFSDAHEFPLFNVDTAVLATFLDVDEPDHDSCTRTQRKHEWEAHPVVVDRVYDCLDYVWAYDT